MSYHPDQKPMGKDNGLMCFKDMTRPCGADCMAFQLERPQGPDYKNQQWANCMILTNQHKSAKHLVILAVGVGKLVEQQQDSVRTNQRPPGVVLPVIPR